MQLKAQDLQTFEAYKKAIRAAASSIKDNTPFCLYSDVEIPDASKKGHTLRPFLVVGSPANAITPMLKDLHGGKKVLCGGLCSLEGGKISLTAKSGKLEYGPLKSQATVFKELLGKEILFPSANGAPAKDVEKTLSAEPFGKITYHGSQESKILPLLTDALKGYREADSKDQDLKDKFQEVDAFSKKIPPLDKVKQEFAKVDSSIKLEAGMMQDMQLHVKEIRANWNQLTQAVKEARKNLFITADDLKAANDIQRAAKIKEQLEMAPWMKLLIHTGEAAVAWAKVEEDPMGTVGPTLEMLKSELEVLGLDKANQQIKALEKEAAELQWKSVVARFKLAQDHLAGVVKLRADLVPMLEQAQDLFKSRVQNLPGDFDDANKSGQFHFKSMTDLQKMLHDYREMAQQAVSWDFQAVNKLHSLQNPSDWMVNAVQDKDALTKMMAVSDAAMKRAIHERDSADAKIKTLSQQIKELEVILSKTKLRPK